MNRTLNEITQDIQKFHDALDLNGGDVELAAQSMGMTFDEFSKAYDEIAFENASKRDAYLFRLEQIKSHRAAAQSMIDQWEARVATYRSQDKSLESQEEWMKARLKMNMEVTGELKFETQEGRKVRIQKNSTKPLLIDEQAFNSLSPPEVAELEGAGVLVTTTEIDKTVAKNYLKSGKELTFAKFGEAGTHLRVE